MMLFGSGLTPCCNGLLAWKMMEPFATKGLIKWQMANGHWQMVLFPREAPKDAVSGKFFLMYAGTAGVSPANLENPESCGQDACTPR